MKKLFFKILLLVLIFLMAFVFASCGKDGPDSKKDPQKPGEIELPIIE